MIIKIRTTQWWQWPRMTTPTPTLVTMNNKWCGLRFIMSWAPGMTAMSPCHCSTCHPHFHHHLHTLLLSRVNNSWINFFHITTNIINNDHLQFVHLISLSIHCTQYYIVVRKFSSELWFEPKPPRTELRVQFKVHHLLKWAIALCGIYKSSESMSK